MRPRLDRLLELATGPNSSMHQADVVSVDATSVDVASVDVASVDVASSSLDVALRFRELYSRAPWERRFDVTVMRDVSPSANPTALGAEATGHVSVSQVANLKSSTAGEGEQPTTAATKGGGPTSEPWLALLGAIDALVRPVLAASSLFAIGADGEPDGGEVCIEAVGFVLSQPGAPAQLWHPDSEHQVGLVNAFVPLVPLTDANGPTALALGSHTGPEHRPACPRVVRPLLNAGEVLLFDWRTWHRGCANNSAADRPVAYVTYARRGVEGASYKRGLPSLEAACSTARGGEAGDCDSGVS